MGEVYLLLSNYSIQKLLSNWRGENAPLIRQHWLPPQPNETRPSLVWGIPVTGLLTGPHTSCTVFKYHNYATVVPKQFNLNPDLYSQLSTYSKRAEEKVERHDEMDSEPGSLLQAPGLVINESSELCKMWILSQLSSLKKKKEFLG